MVKLAQEVNQEDIAALAYKLWQNRYCPEGSPDVDWFRAIDVSAIPALTRSYRIGGTGTGGLLSQKSQRATKAARRAFILQGRFRRFFLRSRPGVDYRRRG